MRNASSGRYDESIGFHCAGRRWRTCSSHRFGERGSWLDFLLPRERSKPDFRWLGRNGRRKFDIQDGIVKGRFRLADLNAIAFPQKGMPSAIF